MEPLSALSIATSVIQFVDFSSKIISGSLEIYKSGHAELSEHSNIRCVTTKLEELAGGLEKSLKLDDSTNSHMSQNDLGLLDLCKGCKTVSDELIAALDKFTRKGKLGKFSSVSQALRSHWSKQHIATLQKRVDSFRQQLMINILVSLREHPAKALQDSVSQVDSAVPEAAREVLKQLLGHLEDERRWRTDLLREIRLSHECDWNNSGAQSQAFTPPTTDDERRYAQFLLHSLKYTAMQDRYEGIAKSHKETFTWVFEEPKEEQKPWSSFIDWLKHGTAPYWITGKAGSGKSTLMKFISRNDETLHYLKEWAGDAKLVVAHFYFWISGSPLQMSQEGLLRSMLLEMLEKEEDQISRAFLRRWESMTILGEYDRDPFTREELEQALEPIVREGSSKMKFCFFIDGLDEYQGDPSELLRLIQRLGAASPHLKFCLSSRPWVAFEDTFKECPKLMLQDLTRRDINRYINSHLRSHDQFPALEIRESDYATTLMDNVANKAEGLFLWVVLVVKSLSDGLTHGVRVSDLQEKLDALPSDLDELFSRILNSIDPANVLHSSQLFQLFRACSSVMRPSITILHYADENNAESFKTFKSKPLRQKVYNAITETMRRRFNHLTKGLLEVSMDTNRVIYLHRTVADYICLPQVWERIASPTAGTSFNPNLILARSLVIEMKIIDPKDFKYR